MDTVKEGVAVEDQKFWLGLKLAQTYLLLYKIGGLVIVLCTIVEYLECFFYCSTCVLVIFNKPKKCNFLPFLSMLGRQSLIFSKTTFTCTSNLFTVSQQWHRSSVQVFIARCSNTITPRILSPFFFINQLKLGEDTNSVCIKNHLTFADVSNLFLFYSISDHSLF